MACLYDHETWKAHPEEFLPIDRRASVVFACNGAMLVELRATLAAAGIETPTSLMSDGVDVALFSPGDETRGHAPPTEQFDALVSLSTHHHLAKDVEALDDWIDGTRCATVQVIELPEPGSSRWTDDLLVGLDADYRTIGERVIDRICSRGGYRRSESLWFDSRYGHRETLVLDRK